MTINYPFHDPNSSHIGVDVNGMTSIATYNLCSPSNAHCTYFFDNNATFIAWVHYYNKNSTLEAHVANASCSTNNAMKLTVLIIQPSCCIQRLHVCGILTWKWDIPRGEYNTLMDFSSNFVITPPLPPPSITITLSPSPTSPTRCNPPPFLQFHLHLQDQIHPLLQYCHHLLQCCRLFQDLLTLINK